MQLFCHSDASYLSEPKSRSRAAGYITCGQPQYISPDRPYKVNAAVSIISRIIPTVVRGAHEAEYAGLFINATELTDLRETASNLGHPQQSIEITYDNTVAGKVAIKDVKKQKYSKVISMNYHWIQDRITANHFHLTWAPGTTNLADYFTKLHPVHHFQSMINVYCNIQSPLQAPRTVKFRKKPTIIPSSY